MSLERYHRRDGLISYSVKFFFHGRCYRRGLGPVSLTQAKLAERKARVEAAEGRFDAPTAPAAPTVPTLKAFAVTFLDSVRTDARPGTVDTYASRIDHHLQPLLGDLRLDEITPAVMDAYRIVRRGEGAAVRTINAELVTLSAILTKAVLHRVLPQVDRAKVTLLRTEERSIRVLSAEEENRLLLAATPRLRPLIVFALQTGLRRGELLSLTWADIDWSRREVLVTGIRAKSRRRRAVPLNRAATTVLRALQGQPARHGRIFGYKSIRAGFSAATRKAGLTGVSCHTLRHTFATRYLEAGGAIHMLQQFLGHASIVTTQRYLHASTEYGRQSIELLAESSQRRSPTG